MTLRKRLMRAMILPGVFGLLVLPGYVLSQTMPLNVTFGENYHVVTPEERQRAVQQARVDDLMVEHDCWSSNGPKGVLPGHAVVTYHGHVRYVGPHLTGWALDQLPEEVTGKPPVNHGLDVHGFCR